METTAVVAPVTTRMATRGRQRRSQGNGEELLLPAAEDNWKTGTVLVDCSTRTTSMALLRANRSSCKTRSLPPRTTSQESKMLFSSSSDDDDFEAVCSKIKRCKRGHSGYKTSSSTSNRKKNIKVVRHDYIDFAGVTEAELDIILKTSNCVKERGPAVSFPIALQTMLDEAEEQQFSEIVSWQPHGRAFKVHDQQRFVSEILPRYFSQRKISSFTRQLNLYGFIRMYQKAQKGCYYHAMCLRGMPFLSRRIKRVRIKGEAGRPKSDPDAEPNFFAMPRVGGGEAQRSNISDERLREALLTSTPSASKAVVIVPSPDTPVVSSSSLLSQQEGDDNTMAQSQRGGVQAEETVVLGPGLTSLVLPPRLPSQEGVFMNNLHQRPSTIRSRRRVSQHRAAVVADNHDERLHHGGWETSGGARDHCEGSAREAGLTEFDLLVFSMPYLAQTDMTQFLEDVEISSSSSSVSSPMVADCEEEEPFSQQATVLAAV